jgi:hypothetical protein
MAVVPGNLVVGNATVFIGADLGAITDGITMTPTFTVYNADIEQELFPSRYWYTDKAFKLEFTLCEPTLENIKLAWDNINAITGASPRVLSFGTSTGPEFVPTPRVISITSFTPSATGLLPTRTVGINKALLETPGATTFSKRQITTLKTTWNCANDGTKVGVFTDAIV